MKRDIEKDLADWFEITEKNKSGGLGYKASCDWREPVGTGVKSNPTPTCHMPASLGVINEAMNKLRKNKYPVFRAYELRHFENEPDNVRALIMKVSLTTYWELIRDGKNYLEGAYDMSEYFRFSSRKADV